MSVNYPDNDYRDYLEHSAGQWLHHKYLYIKNGRYYYDADVARQKVANRLHSAGTNARIAVGNAKAKARTAKRNASTAWSNRNSTIDTSRQKLANRLHSAGTSARIAVGNAKAKARTTKKNASTAWGNRNSTIDTLRQRLANRLHSTGTNARIAVGNAKAKARTAKRNVSNAASNAANRLQAKNINRAVYRKTGVNVSKAVSSARSTISNAIDALKKKRQAKKNRKITGGGAR